LLKNFNISDMKKVPYKYKKEARIKWTDDAAADGFSDELCHHPRMMKCRQLELKELIVTGSSPAGPGSPYQ
jgi:hypothetical protein